MINRKEKHKLSGMGGEISAVKYRVIAYYSNVTHRTITL